MNRATSMLSATAAVAAFALSPAACQCALQWQPGDAIPFAHDVVNASTVWDPDGAGPAPAVLVVGGRFGAGSMLETGIAAFDGTGWSAVGAPPTNQVTALTTWNGLLVATGVAANGYVIATWNGTTWSSIGTTNGFTSSLAVFNGSLFVGGSFSTLGGFPWHSIAQWNGTTWSEPGGGVGGSVSTMAVFGSLHVGGSMTQAGGVPVGNLAIWNGSSWSAGATFDASVRCLAARNGSTPASSFLFAGGDFTTVGGVPAPHIARFSPSTNTWTGMTALPGSTCTAVHVRNTGLATFQLHVAVAGASSPDKVWRQSGTTWVSLGPVVDDVGLRPTSLAFFNGQYVATFRGDPFGATARDAVRVHDGTAWQPAAGPGFDDDVRAVTIVGSDLVVGGTFRRHGTTSLACIARGSPGAWQALGSGMDGGAGVFALCTLPGGDVIAGGDFTTAGGVAANDIARWNGSTWSALGSGINGSVHALLALPDGSVIASGVFSQAGGVAANNVARWNGVAWAPLGLGTMGGVFALARRANGDVVATGQFASAGGPPASNIARWNGTAWSPLGSGLDDTGLALAVLADDSVVVGGSFATAGGVSTPSVARWDGSTWFAQSQSSVGWEDDVHALVALPNGDYLAGGRPSSFGPAAPSSFTSNLARHIGGTASVSWTPLDLSGREVRAAAMLPNGDLVFGGAFDGAGGLASHNVAVLRPSCAATALSYGSGCTGSGGANVLATTALPWTGGTFRARATGMPALALVLAVTGFSQLAVPMPAVLPQGVAGCTVLVSPDLLDVALPAAGVVTTRIAIPAAPSLVGQSFHHQVVPLEVGPAGNILAITSTNALTLTIGVL